MAKLEHLRLGDLSDREILLTMIDVAGPGGYATSQDIAHQLSMGGDNPQRSVQVRLSWLVRYGAVERELAYDEHGNAKLHRVTGEHKKGQGWRPTDIGNAIAQGTLKANQEKMLDGLTDGQILAVTRHVAEQARHMGNHTSSKLIEREWKHRWARVNGWTRP